MTRRTRFATPITLGLAALLCSSTALLAEGSGSIPQPNMDMPQQQLTPQQQAERLYNDGNGYKEKADKLDAEAAATTDPKKKAKLEAKARDKREDSIAKFQKATEKYPQLYQAWGALGHGYKMVGEYTKSLEAYDKSLAIQPGFTPAIEYRGEAYLGLNRLEDVKAAYMELFNLDRPRADTLGKAIDRWIEKNRTGVAGVDEAQVTEFVQWAEGRRKLAEQTSALPDSGHEGW